MIHHTGRKCVLLNSFFRARKKVDKVYVNADGGNTAGCELSESTPLLKSTGEPNTSKEKESKEPKISLAKVLCKAYTWEFAKSNIWKLFYDILVFANPFLLQYVSGLN